MVDKVPSSVRHFALKLSKVLREEITPAWNASREAWIFEISEEQECNEDLHCFMDLPGVPDAKTCDKENHVFTIRTVHAQIKRTHGMNSWTVVGSTIQIDEEEEEDIPIGLIASLLTGPTNPQGDGKVSSASQSTSNQSLATKKNTVIRV